MKIGVDASRVFVNQRTGIEEYSYQVIKHLMKELNNHQVVLYLRKNQRVDFELAQNWKIKVIKWPRLWTQVGLSLELLFHPVDVLFIPAHVVPLIHPKNTIVTIHGLEFEILPDCYSFWARLYMRWSIKFSCWWAKKVIAVSENTKKDLIRLYKIPEEKIEVIYEGVNSLEKSSSPACGRGCPEGTGEGKDSENFSLIRPSATFSLEREKGILTQPYLLFVGRLEKRKNIERIIEAFKILKEKYKIPYKLVLVGKPGYGFCRDAIYRVLQDDIILTGFISEEEKWQLLSNADVFLFPTFYEGFGLPVLEAQSVGVPVVASDNSSIPEIVGAIHELPGSAILCDPKNPESIAEATYELISNPELKNDIIKKGHQNALRFSWEKCASSVAKILNSGGQLSL